MEENKFTNELEIKYPTLEDIADIRVINNNIKILNEQKFNKTEASNKFISWIEANPENRIADANTMKNTGYFRTNERTTNLPNVDNKWGVLQFIAEREGHTGQQFFYGVDGNARGKVFARSLLNDSWDSWKEINFSSTNNNWTGINSFNNLLKIIKNNDILSLEPSDTNNACYIEYKKNKTNRSGVIGFGSSSNGNFEISNEINNGDINLTTRGSGKVKINGVDINTLVSGSSVIKSIQRGTTRINDDTAAISISPVNINKSIVILDTKSSSGMGSMSDYARIGAILEKLETNKITVSCYSYSSVSHSVSWQVIEFN